MEILKKEALGEYEAFVASHPKGHFTQSVMWGKVKSAWNFEAVVSRDGEGNIVGAIGVLVRKVPMFPYTIMYAPRGPVCDVHDENVIKDLVDGIKELAKRNNAYIFRVDPDVKSDDEIFTEIMKKQGFAIKEESKTFDAIQPRYVFRLDVEGKTEDEGSFEFTADMSGRESGLYTVYVTDSDKVNLVYTDKTKNKEAVEWLCGLTSTPSAEEIEAHRNDLGLYNELNETANDSEIAELMYTAVKNGKLNFDGEMTEFDKRNAVIDLYNKMTVISGLNNKSVNDIMKYQDYLTIDESEVADYLDLSFNEKSDFRAELTKRMSNRNFKTEEEFYETLKSE